MAKEMPAGATPLNSNMYLFKSKTNGTDCVISAHGGYMSASRSFTVPAGVRVLFYGPHGASLLDPGLSSFMQRQGDAEQVEVFEGGKDCRNYLLSKYQGAHAGEKGKETVETYQDVAGSVNQRDAVRSSNYARAMKQANMAQPDAKIIALTNEQIRTSQGGSVLTIRNRWNVITGVPLKDAINAARKEQPSLRDFHCVFCRSYMMGDDPLAPVDVKYNWR